MTLIRTSLLNGVAVIVRLLTLLGINKILAIYVGPAGYAAIGQFQNAIQMITTFASGAINTGVTKYTAEHHDDEAKQIDVWRTAGSLAFVGSVCAAVLMVIFSDSLADLFLNDVRYSGVFVWFAAGLLLTTFNALLLAILNGRKEICRYVIANIAGSLFALILTAFMTVKFGLYGALVALAIFQSISFFVTLLLCYKTRWFKLRLLMGRIDKNAALNLAKYAAMAFTSAAVMPVSHVIVRNHLGETFGWAAAGYWEAIWRLSAAYLMLVTTTLSVYYLPRFSELKQTNEIRIEIIQGYKVILPTVAAAAIVMYLMRDVLIQLLFTEDFTPMRNLFGWQMTGDVLKVGSWILAYLILSKAMFKVFIVAELAFSAMFVMTTMVLTRFIGLEGVAVAHAINYGIYWVVLAYVLTKKLRGQTEVPRTDKKSIND